MTRTLFPILPAPPAQQAAGLPLFRDIAMDFDRGIPLFAGGNPMIAEGLEAVKGWAFRMLKTARYRYAHFSWDIGSELEALVGQPYSTGTKLAEASRYVQDALLVSPYITDVRVTKSSFAGTTLALTIALTTVYGEATIYV